MGWFMREYGEIEVELDGMDLVDAARLMCLPTLGRNKRKVEVIASRVGIAASTLYNILDRHRPLEAQLIPALTHATGDGLLIDAVAYQCGRLAIPVAQTAGRGPVMAALVEVIREHADIPATVCNMMGPESDGGGAGDGGGTGGAGPGDFGVGVCAGGAAGGDGGADGAGGMNRILGGRLEACTTISLMRGPSPGSLVAPAAPRSLSSERGRSHTTTAHMSPARPLPPPSRGQALGKDQKDERDQNDGRGTAEAVAGWGDVAGGVGGVSGAVGGVWVSGG